MSPCPSVPLVYLHTPVTHSLCFPSFLPRWICICFHLHRFWFGFTFWPLPVSWLCHQCHHFFNLYVIFVVVLSHSVTFFRLIQGGLQTLWAPALVPSWHSNQCIVDSSKPGGALWVSVCSSRRGVELQWEWAGTEASLPPPKLCCPALYKERYETQSTICFDSYELGHESLPPRLEKVTEELQLCHRGQDCTAWTEFHML